MKKINYLLWIMISLLLPLSLASQIDWAPVGAVWTYQASTIDGSIYQCKIEAIKDTLIHERSCTILTSDCLIPGNLSRIIISFEKDKVYQYVENQNIFGLLYDFSVEKGDTIEIWVPYNANENIHREVVDSVGMLKSDSINYRIYWTSRLPDNSAWLLGGSQPIVEKIGGLNFLLPQDELSEESTVLLSYQDSCFSFTYDVNNCNPQCGYLIEDNCNSIVSASNLLRNTSFYVYPIPANNIIIIEFKESTYCNSHLRLYDQNGKLVYSLQTIDIGQYKIDVSNLQNGIYFLQLVVLDKSFLKKVIVQH